MAMLKGKTQLPRKVSQYGEEVQKKKKVLAVSFLKFLKFFEPRKLYLTPQWGYTTIIIIIITATCHNNNKDYSIWVRDFFLKKKKKEKEGYLTSS